MRPIWKKAKEILTRSMTTDTFQRWIAPLRFLEGSDSTVVVGCPNAFFRDWVDQHHRQRLEEALEEANGKGVRIQLKVEASNRTRATRHPGQQLSFAQLSPSPLWESGLNGNYTFDRFVVGPCNEFAYNASVEVARARDKRYNPLLLLADVGLGKSHLSCAIGNHIQSRHREDRVFYTTAEGFVNDMVRCLKSKQLETFKEKFRKKCDVLVLDGVQFLSGKSRTQMELAHTLDALQNANKQVILTSNVLPRAIREMDETLRSRISSGLMADIKSPDLPTRCRILKQKASQEGFQLTDQVTRYIAESVSGNVRQLQGIIIHLQAKASLLHRPVDLDLAKETVQELFQERSSLKKPTIEEIQSCICKFFRMERETLISPSRKKAVYYPRQVAMYLCRHHTDATLTAIGKAFRRDHASVLHSLAVIDRKCKADTATRNQITFLADEITTGK